MKRRRFLQQALCLGAASTWPFHAASALGPQQKVRLVRLRHGGGWNARADAVSVLAQELRFRTSVDVAKDVITMAPDDPALARSPLAVLAGNTDFALSRRGRESIARWISLGGLLLVDNCSPDGQSAAFDGAVRRELAAMFPRTSLERLSPEHVVYRSFYRLDYPAGRAIHRPYVEGLPLGRRMGVVVSHNDLLGALARDSAGRYLHVPRPGGENQREMALRFAVNLAMYGLCLHYKDDQVHLDYLLHRRKWKIRRPE